MSVRITELLEPACLVDRLPQGNVEQVLGALVDRLHLVGRIADPKTALARLLDRERLMSTAVQPGFAFPHAFGDEFSGSLVALGVVPEGVDFGSGAKGRVYFIFLLLASTGSQGMHLRVLARLSRLARQPEMLEAMRAAGSPDELLGVLKQCEDQFKTDSPGRRAG